MNPRWHRCRSFLILLIVSTIGTTVVLAADHARSAPGAGLNVPELDRVERAFAVGMAQATSGEDQLSCRRLRCESLQSLSERTYQAVLARLSHRPDLAAAVQMDQQRWQQEVGDPEMNSPEALDTRAAAMTRRILVLHAVARWCAANRSVTVLVPDDGISAA